MRRVFFSRGFWVFAAASLVLLSAIVGGKSLVSKLFRGFLESRRFANIESLAPSITVRVDDEKLILSSFTDLFSGVGWVNETETTLYRDNTAQAFTWRPVFLWGANEKGQAAEAGKECLGARCGAVSGESFVFDGISLALPRELERDGRKLAVRSNGKIITLVGIVPSGGKRKGYAFSFDGSNFKPLCADPLVFVSDYDGMPGIGTDGEGFLAVYGAYEGKAFEFRNGSCADASKFFGIRPMYGGFQPRIVSISGTKKTWFVFSADGQSPVLLKGITDPSTGFLVGMVDIGSSLRRDGTVGFSFSTRQTGDGALAGTIAFADGGKEIGILHDYGFESQKKGIIVSKNLNTYPGSDVRRATIVSLDLFPGSTEPKFFLSNDGEDWTPAIPGTEVVFRNKEGKTLFWKAEFPNAGDGVVPPYLRRIRVDFKVKL